MKETLSHISFKNSPLGRRILFFILSFSTITTLFLTTIQIYFDYRMGVKSIERTIAEVGSTQLSTLIENLWTMNQDQVRIQLQGLLEIESITELSIIPPEDREFHSKDLDEFTVKKTKKKSYSHALRVPGKIVEYYPLIYIRDNQQYSLGSLKIVGDKGPVVDALQSRVLIILLTQGAKTFIVSFFIILIFNTLVNRHIMKVSYFAKRVSLENMSTMLSLDRSPPKAPDELDQLVQSLNLMQIKITNEIAQRKHFEQQLRQSQKMEALGTLSSGIAHDFNNILQGLYNALFLIEEEVIDNAEALSHLNLATNMTDRARELIKQILIFSRQEEGHFSEFSPTAAIQDVVEILRAARPKEISIDFLLDLPKAKIYGDQTQLKQVVLNLGNNAIGALEGIERPQITIKVSSQTVTQGKSSLLSSGKYLKIEVKDNGYGIDAEILERIFEPFFTTKEVGRGTGLGLSVVHGIVQSHGGATFVESKIGEGSTFQVYIPFVEPKPMTSIVTHCSTEDIHLVSRDTQMITELTRLFKKIGHKRIHSYAESSSALETIKLLRHEKIKSKLLFIIDEEVDGFSSIELIRKLRQFFPITPILYLTNSNTPSSQFPAGLKIFPFKKEMPLDSETLHYALNSACQLIS